jgi:hypothetical protein
MVSWNSQFCRWTHSKTNNNISSICWLHCRPNTFEEQWLTLSRTYFDPTYWQSLGRCRGWCRGNLNVTFKFLALVFIQTRVPMYEQYKRIWSRSARASQIESTINTQGTYYQNNFQVVSGWYIEKEYQVREPRLTKYLHSVQKMESYFLGVTTIPSILRADDSNADKVA